MVMYIFWLISLLMANGYRHNVALADWQHTEHVAHVRHIEHENYLKFLTRPVETTIPPTAPIVQPAPAKNTYVAPAPPVATYSAPSGDYSCSSLESLWVSVGGNPADEVIAASIATAESGGNPDAISPTDDYGLWQINASWGPLASLNPITNAHSAVTISDDGTNWTPWTTYTSGAYYGLC